MLFFNRYAIPAIPVERYLDTSRRVVKKGKSFGSLEDDETAGLDYSVITGDVIAEAFPELSPLFSRMAADTARVFGPHYQPANNSKRCYNINILGEGQRYEKHVDGNAVTGLLYLNDDYVGGELLCHAPTRLLIPPVTGLAIIFAGGQIPHEVLPVHHGLRLSLTVNFELHGESQNDVLNDELYTSNA